MKHFSFTKISSLVLTSVAVSFFHAQEDTKKDKNIDEVVILGSRSTGRVKTETPAPVDVFDINKMSANLPQSNLNQILTFVAPSFQSNTQTVADGTDHIDPAQLRGLGPDQVLVLVNAKRRHNSSLVNVNGTVGRGSVGTDLNAIPAFAVSKIEVLRDGAAAQYGSDAIAGVMNLGLKRSTDKLTGIITLGANQSQGSNNHNGGMDGQNFQIDLNYGVKLPNKGFINFTGSGQFREPTSRAGVATGTIFNGYNAVEERARLAGQNINSLFSNINNTPNTTQIIDMIKQYAPQVSYFTSAQQSNIQAATSIAALQGILNVDVSDSEIAFRGLKRTDFNMRVGQSSMRSGQFFVNSEIPLNENWKAYAFGGYGSRSGVSAGFYRRPAQNRTYTGLFPNGFLPEITSVITDLSLSAGVKGKWSGWNVDLSNTFGSNNFAYGVQNTSNATLGMASPKTFKAGDLGFSQNTINLDFSKLYDGVMSGLNFAFGAETRFENYSITAGELTSSQRYDISGNVITTNPPANQVPTDFFGSVRPGGSQVFPGFRSENALSKGRTSMAAYVDTELNISKEWLLAGALRFENYSDFGSTLNYKLATRYKISDNFNIRAAGSTGFRAPSLSQKYYNATATQFVGGVPFEVGTFANDSKAAQLLGIPNLKQETSMSLSGGFTYKIPTIKLSLTADAYFTRINDRVVLTDQFSRPTNAQAAASPAQATLQQLFDQANATAATFFSNAIDTNTKGLDVVISHSANLGTNKTLNNDFAINLNKTQQVGDIKASPALEAAGQINRYYSETSRIYTEEAVPRVKANLTHTLTINKWNLMLRNVYFGQITDPNTTDVNGDGKIGAIVVNGVAVENEHPIWGARMVTDLSVGYNFTKQINVTIGANNVLDIYPDKNYGPMNVLRPNGVDANGNVTYATTPTLVNLSNDDQFVYSRNATQFGMNGRFLFAKINFNF